MHRGSPSAFPPATSRSTSRQDGAPRRRTWRGPRSGALPRSARGERAHLPKRLIRTYAAASASTISTAANGAAAANATGRAVGVELGPERVAVERQQHLGRREVAEREREDEHDRPRRGRDGRAAASRGRSSRAAPAPSARAESSSAGSSCPSVARSATTANGTNRIASANTSSAKLP